jgi:hypothetical protein
MVVEIGPSTLATRSIVLGCLSGLTKLGLGQVKTTARGGFIPPGIVKLRFVWLSHRDVLSERNGCSIANLQRGNACHKCIAACFAWDMYELCREPKCKLHIRAQSSSFALQKVKYPCDQCDSGQCSSSPTIGPLHCLKSRPIEDHILISKAGGCQARMWSQGIRCLTGNWCCQGG